MAVRQSGAISGGSRRRNQVAELNARQNMLPQILANQRYAEGIAREDALTERDFAFRKKAAKKLRKAEDRASEVGLGLEASKLGLTVSGQYGGKSFGEIGGDARALFGGSSKPMTFGGGKSGNFFSNMSAGSLLGGGLAGFGAAKLLGGKKSKLIKGLVGAGVGAGMGLLSGGNSLGGAISGGFSGGLGGLFG